MVIIRKACGSDGDVLFEPQDYANYAAEIARHGWEPPPHPIAIRWRPDPLASPIAEAFLNRQIAGFFLLGPRTGIDYEIRHTEASASVDSGSCQTHKRL